jgi:hypothetical protein
MDHHGVLPHHRLHAIIIDGDFGCAAPQNWNGNRSQIVSDIFVAGKHSGQVFVD